MRDPQQHEAERGQATAEYAVGTVGAAGVGFVLVQLARAGWFQELVQSIIAWITVYEIPFRPL